MKPLYATIYYTLRSGRRATITFRFGERWPSKAARIVEAGGTVDRVVLHGRGPDRTIKYPSNGGTNQ